jgi:hypothetical protein
MQAGATGRAALLLATVAICSELAISANLLTVAGVPYVAEGGALIVKFHPGTMLLAVAVAGAVLAGGAAWLRSVEPSIRCYLTLGAICILSAFLLTGPGNLIVLLDTFLPAGLAASILSKAPEAALLRLRRCMQVLLAADAAIALAEMAAKATLVPLYLNDAIYHPHVEDFRPTALFDHPLTGAVMMMIGLSIAPAGRIRRAYQGLIWAALFAFGGRMAFGVSLASSVTTAAQKNFHLILRRDRRAGFSLLAAVAFVSALGLLLGVMAASGFGERLTSHLYWDQSAQVRVQQWRILQELDGSQLLFGAPRDVLLADLNAMRLASGVEVIENFWLLMFVSLGAVGFPFFLAMLGSLCVWCWQRGAREARILMLSVLLVASTSNSLGRKSTVLVCLVAAICCLPRPGRPQLAIQPTALRVAA